MIGNVTHAEVRNDDVKLRFRKGKVLRVRLNECPARVSVALYLAPLYSAGVGWAVLHEPVSDFHAVGALLILPGIWLSTRRPSAA